MSLVFFFNWNIVEFRFIVVVLQKAILLWMYDPATRDAVMVKEALCGETVHLRRATEIMCSRTSSQIQHLRQLYLSMFQSYIEHDIQHTTSGDHKKVTYSLFNLVLITTKSFFLFLLSVAILFRRIKFGL